MSKQDNVRLWSSERRERMYPGSFSLSRVVAEEDDRQRGRKVNTREILMLTRTVIALLILFMPLLTSCLSDDAGSQQRIAEMSYDDLQSYLEDVYQPVDSLSYAMARYVLLSRQEKDLGEVLKVLENVKRKSRQAGHEEIIGTDVDLGKALACVDRMNDSTVIGIIANARKGIENHVGGQTVMRRYVEAAFASLLTFTDEGYELTIDLCRNAIAFAANDQNVTVPPEIYNFMGQAAYNSGEVVEAMATLTKALYLAHETGNGIQEARAYAALARGVRNESLFLQEQMMVEKAFALVSNSPAGEAKSYICRSMGWACEDRQDPDSALFYLRMAKSICDTMHFVSLAEEILVQDIRRIEEAGCRQQDSTMLTRAQCLQEYTQTLIDMEKKKIMEDMLVPEISRTKHTMYVTMGVCLILVVFGLVCLLIYRRNQMLRYAEKEACLRGMASHLHNVTTQYNDTSHQLEEVRNQLSETEQSRQQLSLQISDMESRISNTENQLRSTKRKLTNRENSLTQLRQAHKEQQSRLDAIETRFTHKDFNIEDVIQNPRKFVRDFLTTHPNFEKGLKGISPSISSRDTLLCILIVLDVDKEDIAQVFNIRAESLNVSRHRLRSRLKLAREENLYTTLLSLL